jgi:EAL domain-containing protein (putative c-di-GMP-specific phosphodiesterase class I)
MGIQGAVDDFGVAYSCLNYLKRLPADRLKIDRSFIRNIPDNADDNAITTTIITMAHSLGLAVIAEGVETKAQLAFLIQKACNEVQGYLYSRPLNMQNLQHFLSRNRAPVGQPEPDENVKRTKGVGDK